MRAAPPPIITTPTLTLHPHRAARSTTAPSLHCVWCAGVNAPTDPGIVVVVVVVAPRAVVEGVDIVAGTGAQLRGVNERALPSLTAPPHLGPLALRTKPQDSQ
eukprot:1148597-Pelagomonas_calceolata.AAC.12